jgi:hypothetical protein
MFQQAHHFLRVVFIGVPGANGEIQVGRWHSLIITAYLP